MWLGAEGPFHSAMVWEHSFIVKGGLSQLNQMVKNILQMMCLLLCLMSMSNIGPIFEDYRKKWISSIAMGAIYHTKWRLVQSLKVLLNVATACLFVFWSRHHFMCTSYLQIINCAHHE